MQKMIGKLVVLVALSPAWYPHAADSSVEHANALWDQTFNKGDAHALAALYDEKAVVSPGNGKTVQGRDEIEKLFKSFFDAGVHDHATSVVHASHHGNVMYETANWSAMLDKDGKKQAFKGVLLKVMTRGTDGKWRTTAHTWNAAENK
ncbi:Ketosteroid isomerase [Candidatus Burkholderia verschuerenii]|uniref:Ketosteroid isomerase n=1 Tax=Candidatus Burkholderia verschuerenii TaxID=242163 RepID=A0A0L0MH37_9BURK|nr:SgcJ/EcaC family oxidoreductase [Candidatus Burkholderia verschuerenii]KND61606.1 Ketosteroid isomerase [Candidatus Burkholderia verschuerenii]